MKKIITIVGTSLFTNYLFVEKEENRTFKQNRCKSIETAYKTLERNEIEKKKYKEEDNASSINDITRKIPRYWLAGWQKEKKYLDEEKHNYEWKWKKKNDDIINYDASAEIKSIYKIKNEDEYKNEELHIYLLATDTILSPLAAKIIKDNQKTIFKEFGDSLKIFFEPEKDIITGLQVYDSDRFESKGLENLIKRFVEISKEFTSEEKKYNDYLKKFNINDSCLKPYMRIEKGKVRIDTDRVSEECKKQLGDKVSKSLEKNSQSCYDTIIFNITGGYKSIIPYITIFAQLYKRPVYYIFEESDDCLKIPQLPIQFDWGLVDLYYPFFSPPYFDSKNREFDPNKIKEETLNKLKELYLANKENGLTSIGELMASFVENKLLEGKKTFGLIVEYKIFEYYYRSRKYEKIEHSINIRTPKKELEVDLILYPSYPVPDKNRDWTKSIFVEVKSFNEFNKKSNNKKDIIVKNIQDRIKEGDPNEFYLCVYKHPQIEIPNERIEEIKSKLSDEGKNKLTVFYFDIDLSLYEKGNSNPYQSFLQKKEVELIEVTGDSKKC